MKLAALILLLGFGLAGCSSPQAPRNVSDSAVRNTIQFSGTYFDVKDANPAPALMRPGIPRYPRELRLAGIEGYATIQYIIETDGATSEVQVEEASHAAFGAAAVDAVRQMRFRTPLVNGQPARVAVKQTLTFNVGNPG